MPRPIDVDDAPLLRNSERGSFTRCRWAWERAYVDQIKPRREKPALRFGTLIHKALEAYYVKGIKRGLHPAETFLKVYDAQVKQYGEFNLFSDEEWIEARILGVDMLEQYVDHYGKDPAWKVLATEFPFQVPVMHPRTGKLWFYSVGVIDLVVEDRERGKIFMVDHKTIGKDPTNATAYLAVDDQAGAYWRYGQQAIREAGFLPDSKILSGITFNYLRKAKRDTRPKNAAGLHLNGPLKPALVAYAKQQKLPFESKMTVAQLIDLIGPPAEQLGEVSKVQPAPYFYREPVYRTEEDGESVHLRVLQQYREMLLARQGKLATYKAPEQMKCNGCGVRDLCELDEMGQNWRAVAEETHQLWNPYGEHEIEDEGRGK